MSSIERRAKVRRAKAEANESEESLKKRLSRKLLINALRYADDCERRGDTKSLMAATPPLMRLIEANDGISDDNAEPPKFIIAIEGDPEKGKAT